MEQFGDSAENGGDLQQLFTYRDFLNLLGSHNAPSKANLRRLFHIAANHARARKRGELTIGGRTVTVSRSAIEDILENWRTGADRKVYGIGEKSVALLEELLRPTTPSPVLSEEDIQAIADRYLDHPSPGIGHRVVSALATCGTRLELTHLVRTEGRRQQIDARLVKMVVEEGIRPQRLAQVGMQVVELTYAELYQNAPTDES